MLKKNKFTDAGKIHVFIVGDSTACEYSHNGADNQFPRAGWGQFFGELFTDDIIVVNYALSGRSSKSFLTEDNFKLLQGNIKKGDYLFIQFAHNDSKSEDRTRYTSPDDGSYQKCVSEFTDLAQKAGAHPVLCTSITRNLPLDTSLEPYGEALKKIGLKNNIPVLDIYSRTHCLLGNGAEDFYMRLEPRDERFISNAEFTRSQYYEKGAKDNTHLNINGARRIAKIVAEEIESSGHPLAKYLK